MTGTIGERIRIARLARNMTQEDLAIAIGTTKQNIYKYETGIITNIPLEKIYSMAETMHINPAWVMGWSKYMDENHHPISRRVRSHIENALNNIDETDLNIARETQNIELLESTLESSEPISVDDAVEIADIIGVSVLELLEVEPTGDGELEDVEFIRQFRMLESANQKRILDLMQALLESHTRTDAPQG